MREISDPEPDPNDYPPDIETRDGGEAETK
jgi:hypothetical protein